jgi:hypothetical protein
MEQNGAKKQGEIINESLALDSREIASAITGYFDEMGTLNRRGFALFIADYDTGTITYTSDIEHTAAIGMIAAWIDREKQ